METKRSTRKVCSMIGLALLGMMVVWFVGQFALLFLFRSAWPDILTRDWGYYLLNDLALYALGMPVLLLIFKFIPEKSTPEPERPKMKMNPWRFILILVFCLGSMYLLSILSQVLILWLQSITAGLFPYTGEYVTTSDSSLLDAFYKQSGVLIQFLFSVLVPAFGEEFIFRYLIYRKMRGSADVHYVLLSGLTFGLFHANLGQFLFASVVGFTFAWVYKETKNIWYPIALHGLANTVGAVVVPSLYDTGINMAFFGVFVIAAIILALLIFGITYNRVTATFKGPTEEGWPYRVPARVMRAHALATMGPVWSTSPYMPPPPVPYYTAAPSPWPYPGGPGSVPTYPPPPLPPYSPSAVQSPVPNTYPPAAPYGAPAAQSPSPVYPPSPAGSYNTPVVQGPVYTPAPAPQPFYGQPAQPVQPPMPPAYPGQAQQVPPPAAYPLPPQPIQQPYYQPQYPQPMPYYTPQSLYGNAAYQYAAQQVSQPRAFAACFKNLGMILFLSLASILTLLTSIIT